MLRSVDIDTNDPSAVARYERLFDECPDACIQQSLDWCRAIRGIGPDRPIFLLCTDGEQDLGGLPLYLYEAPAGNVLTSVPQPGPLGGVFCRPGLTDEQSAEVYRILLERAVSLAQQHECLTLSVITNPFVDDLDLYERVLSPHFVLENFTQYIPLDRPTHRNHGHRNNVNRGRKAGFTVELCKDEADLAAWYRVHEKRHREIGAIPLEYRLFESLFRCLVPKGKAQLVLLKMDGVIVSGGFYVYHRRIMDVFMLSFDSAWEKKAPNFLNTDYSIDWARGQGLAIYNWQSSANKRCGVYEYKRQWGSVDRPYYFVTRMIGDPARVAALGSEGLRRQYPWHYVVPFGVFETGFGQKRFTKG